MTEELEVKTQKDSNPPGELNYTTEYGSNGEILLREVPLIQSDNLFAPLSVREAEEKKLDLTQSKKEEKTEVKKSEAEIEKKIDLSSVEEPFGDLFEGNLFGLPTKIEPTKEETRIKELERKVQELESGKSSDSLRTELREELSEVLYDLDDEKQDKLLTIFEKLSESIINPKLETTKSEYEERLKNQEELNQQALELSRIYNGQNGRPTIMDMKGPVDYIGELLGDDILNEIPLTATFKIAEDVPFIDFARKRYPEQFNQFIPRESDSLEVKMSKANSIYRISQALKKRYIELQKESTEETIERTNNNQDKSLENLKQKANSLKQETSLNTGGGEIRPIHTRPKKPQTARDIIRESISEIAASQTN